MQAAVPPTQLIYIILGIWFDCWWWVHVSSSTEQGEGFVAFLPTVCCYIHTAQAQLWYLHELAQAHPT